MINAGLKDEKGRQQGIEKRSARKKRVGRRETKEKKKRGGRERKGEGTTRGRGLGKLSGWLRRKMGGT